MGRLLQDRYFEYAPDRAWDLATGENVDTAHVTSERGPGHPALAPLVEVLEHGREGTPRWIVADTPPGLAPGLFVEAAAEEARSRGFVPVAVDVYARLRTVLDEELRDRALVLVARPRVPVEVARAMLVDAAARSSRPHVLLSVRAAGPSALPGSGHLVREARAVYGAQPLRAASVPPVPQDVLQHIVRASRAYEFVRAGRHAAAERLLRDVIGALVRRRASAAAAETFVTLGKVLLERGRAAHADNAFGEAVTQAEAVRDEALAMTARIWQAAARTDTAQLTAAESLCRAVIVAGAVGPAERMRAEATLARVFLWQDRAEEAAELKFVAASAGAAGDPFVQGTAIRVLIERGQFFEAGRRAREFVTMTAAAADPLTRLIAVNAHLRVLLAIGDLLVGEERLRELHAEARTARSPLRAARASLLWVDALRRAGRERDAAAILRGLERLRTAAPALLRAAIERRLHGGPRPAAPPLASSGIPAAATALVTIAQREDGDRDALARLFEFMATALRSSRVDLWSADAGPMSTVLSAGNGLVTRLGGRILEAGIPIGPEQGDSGHEIGVPVRLGARLLAALCARWPADSVPRPDAFDLIRLAAAVAAPRVDLLLAAGREESRAATVIPELVGVSGAIADVRKAVARAAASPFAVLIAGESGVGKELVARAIHQLGPRRERRFCDVNCAALPDDLIESELFGHARGAFTGAVTERAGLIEEADGGTLFLDEMLDLSPRAQAKLLRVVQQQEVRRVGETFTRKVDVRLVSAANRDVRAEAASGRFREDLLYRLDVIRIHIPALRERPEDIPLLIEHFWRQAAARVGTTATVGHSVLAALSRYHWPGNVRELQNVTAALAVAAPARGILRPALLPSAITGVAAVTSGRLDEARAQFERRFVEVALARAGGSRSQAARELGISRQGLLKLMARLGMQPRS